MAIDSAPGAARATETGARWPDAERRFSWLVTVTSAWILAGLYLDGWFHLHRDGESFFTPWHAVLYSGVASSAAVHLRDVRSSGVRAGYGPSLAGLLIVGMAGAADLAWHTLLGVEADLDALLSPPHLLLITAGVVGAAGPLRAALRDAPGRRPALPAAFSAAFVVAGLAFFTQYANPITHLYPVAGWDDTTGLGAAAQQLPPDVAALRAVVGVSGIGLLASLLGGAVAMLRGRTALATGSLLVVVAVPVAFLVTLRGTFVLLPGVLVAAGLTELLGRRLQAAPLAAFAAGAVMTSWVLTLAVAYDLVWGPELLAGSVGSAVAAGFLAGWLVEPVRTTAAQSVR